MIVKITVVNSFLRYSLRKRFAIAKPLISLKKVKCQDYVSALYLNLPTKVYTHQLGEFEVGRKSQ
jgi:hypothetical protein